MTTNNRYFIFDDIKEGEILSIEHAFLIILLKLKKIVIFIHLT